MSTLEMPPINQAASSIGRPMLTRLCISTGTLCTRRVLIHPRPANRRTTPSDSQRPTAPKADATSNDKQNRGQNHTKQYGQDALPCYDPAAWPPASRASNMAANRAIGVRYRATAAIRCVHRRCARGCPRADQPAAEATRRSAMQAQRVARKDRRTTARPA